MADRYREIIKENDEIVKYLSDSYQNIATIYVKKARGFGVKSIDTEVKIKETLVEIRDFDEKGTPYAIAIPNETTFINERMKSISKKSPNKEKITSIIAGTILIVVMLAWIIGGQILARTVHLEEPKDVIAIQTSNTNIEVSWRDVQLATHYDIYMVTPSGKELATRTISSTKYVFDCIDEPGIYKVYVRCAANKNFGCSEWVIEEVDVNSKEGNLKQPTDVKAIFEDNKIIVTWNKAEAADQYDIYLIDPDGRETQIKTIKELTYTFNEINLKGKYKVRVRSAASDKYGCSDWVIINLEVK